jgi:hypothetical protein
MNAVMMDEQMLVRWRDINGAAFDWIAISWMDRRKRPLAAQNVWQVAGASGRQMKGNKQGGGNIRLQSRHHQLQRLYTTGRCPNHNNVGVKVFPHSIQDCWLQLSEQSIYLIACREPTNQSAVSMSCGSVVWHSIQRSSLDFLFRESPYGIPNLLTPWGP